MKPSAELELSLARVEIPKPAPHEVLVRIDAAPIHPSDLALLLGPAFDPTTVKSAGTAELPIITAKIHEKALRLVAGRVGQAMPVGNEGAGLVVEAGADPKAQALLGKTVAFASGGTYAQYRCISAATCIPLPEDISAAQGAASFVNPLTALGMVETMRAEGHRALVHTAAASSLGQMLVRLCEKDGVPLVNVVRKDEQVKILRDLGAKYVCNSSSPTFRTDLNEAIAATGATIAFDAIAGGKLVSLILSAMETALNSKAESYSRYGSSTHKQVYIYGMLDLAPTEITRDFGLAWGVGGWLLMPFLQKMGPGVKTLHQRVGAELTTTFATSYAKEISLAGMLQPAELLSYAQRATGGKVLVTPNKMA